MKKTAENRYPHSATLFKFCKRALEMRYEGNVKVIDQDVGAILGYDPADCSHWKKGKKNIRALGTLRSIASHLNIDERLLIEITSGKVGLEEALFEFKGYGAFSLKGRKLESLKKDFFKNPTKWQKEGQTNSFEELFNTDRNSIDTMAQSIIEAGNFKEAPIYIPEVANLYPNITLISDETQEEPVIATYEGEGTDLKATIKFRGPEMKPYVRFMIAKELFKFLVASSNPIAAKFKHTPSEVIDIQANLFAGMLLVPKNLLSKEVESIDSSLDIVLQLAETFWISKALMNQRLKDYMEYLN